MTQVGQAPGDASTKHSKDISNTSILNTDDAQSHRALIFCQIKKFMYMIEHEVLKKFDIKYLLLDSTLTPKQRFEVAEKFNNHPKYKILLLTTNIGSLGLNLTGADTVIFMEHDWNPMKDLQAIDRAHRIGQTKTVTVYRLIAMATLEEKIMNLQRFKKKLHRMLITERETTGSTGKDDEEGKVEVQNILRSFENQDSYKKELEKTLSSSKGVQNQDEDYADFECENYLSNVDKKWLNLEES